MLSRRDFQKLNELCQQGRKASFNRIFSGKLEENMQYTSSSRTHGSHYTIGLLSQLLIATVVYKELLPTPKGI